MKRKGKSDTYLYLKSEMKYKATPRRNKKNRRISGETGDLRDITGKRGKQ